MSFLPRPSFSHPQQFMGVPVAVICHIGPTVRLGTVLESYRRSFQWGIIPAGIVFSCWPLSAAAAAMTGGVGNFAGPDLSAQKIFTMLFLMLGPLKILIPVARLTMGLDRRARMRIATRAIAFSAAALLLAGAMGRSILDNFGISVPVLALTGGLILFLMALQTVLAPPSNGLSTVEEEAAGRNIALNPLAFPVIVTPYGIAAVIVFTTLAWGTGTWTVIAAVITVILAMNWIAMIFAAEILSRIGTALQIFTVVLGVAQIALGLQVMVQSLGMMGVLPPA
jgi:multiple antibiotic resistance protein